MDFLFVVDFSFRFLFSLSASFPWFHVSGQWWVAPSLSFFTLSLFPDFFLVGSLFQGLFPIFCDSIEVSSTRQAVV